MLALCLCDTATVEVRENRMAKLNKKKFCFFTILACSLTVCYLLDGAARIELEYDRYVWHYSDESTVQNENHVGHGLCRNKINRSSLKSPLEVLSDQVQEAICRLQNPSNCSEARLLLCRIRCNCALGCQLHHFISCLTLAVGTNRTLLVDNANMWRVKRGLLGTYQPLSDVCTKFTRNDVTQAIDLADATDSMAHRIAKVTIYNRMIATKFHPLAVPDVLSQPLQNMTKLPAHVWWIGQLAKFVTRPQRRMTELLESVKSEIRFLHPIVGVHVRRSDKLLVEAEARDLDEYMAKVKVWFDKYDKHSTTRVKRRVFLATDDPDVYTEAVTKYPGYEILSMRNSSRARLVDTQFFHQFNLYSPDELRSIVLDIRLLSECDYLVCTFSSNVGQLVYELMSTRVDLNGEFATSLDKPYSYHQIVKPQTFETFEGLKLPHGLR